MNVCEAASVIPEKGWDQALDLTAIFINTQYKSIS
jgi:hypothetical protein